MRAGRGLDESVQVPFGSFDGALKTQGHDAARANLVEFKFYAKDVGPVFVVAVSGGTSLEELLDVRARAALGRAVS